MVREVVGTTSPVTSLETLLPTTPFSQPMLSIWKPGKSGDEPKLSPISLPHLERLSLYLVTPMPS
ncbi:Uncharacterised protein [uncultured archaeon]|nr:Uncharacterised protein [uncultured archaeon]